MRKLLLIVGISLFAIAGYYPSIHQLTKTKKGLINELKEMVRKGYTSIGDVYIDIQDDAAHHKDTWCGRRFNRIKIYIPPGLKHAKVFVVMRPNSSIFILKKFIPEGRPVEQVIDWTKLESDWRYFYAARQKSIGNVGIILDWRYGKEKYFKDMDVFRGGWLYVQLIQASQFLDSYFGHISSPSAQVIVEYEYDPKHKQILDEWLKNTKFNTNGDPVDRFDTIEEKVRYCSDFGKAEKIRGIKDSDITGYELFYGVAPDPYTPKYAIEADKASIRGGESVTLTSTLVTREASLEGISVEINQNTTTGVLLENRIESSCATFAQANGEDDYAQGKLIYSDNGANWYDNPNDEAIADNIRYIGYLLSGSYPKASKARLSVKLNISSDCSESLKDTATLHYMMDGEEKSIRKTLTLPYGTASSSSSSESAPPSNSGGYSGGGNSGGGSGTISSGAGDGWNGYGSTSDESNHERELCQARGGRWVDNVCLDAKTGSSSSSSFSSAQSSWSSAAAQNGDESNHERELCQARGGRWVDNVCLDAKTGSSSSSSSSSIESSSAASQSNEQKICQERGGRWVDNVCLDAGSSSSSSASSKESEEPATPTRIEKVVATLAKKELPVRGYFVHYGSGAFDWIYRSSGGGLYKLEGMDENGYFQWTPLTKYFTSTEVREGKLILGEAKITRDLDTRALNTIRAIRSNDSYPINGYFTNYGDGAFDWAYVMGDKIYKLDGMDENGYFKWLPLTDYFEGIEVQDYTKIKIGENRIEKELRERKEKCENDGGQWKQEEGRWMCIWEEKIVISSSTSSNSSSSSFSSSSSVQSSSSSSTSSIASSSSTANTSNNGTGAFPNLF